MLLVLQWSLLLPLFFPCRDGDGQLTYHVDGACSESVSVVEVGPEGVVKAGEQTGQATVIVTVTESYGVTQSLSVLVEVSDEGGNELEGIFSVVLPVIFDIML